VTDPSTDPSSTRIQPIDVEEEMKRSFLDYAMSVIVSRALPDVRDGLKPVHRRILWGMLEQGIRPGSPRKKSARVVGDVLGKYHPHGDQAVYDALVRLGQGFSSRYPLIDPQGNFGSADGDPAAAMRYTEARLSSLAMELLTDLDKDTVDFVPNYDGEEREPSVMPSHFPNLLANGSSGIAVGMATNIPPHNLSEVIDATVHLIDHPEAGPEDLMAFVKGPDFPTGGQIMGMDGIRQAYLTGRGSVRVRAKVKIEEASGGGHRIVVTELPYQVSGDRLLEKVAELVKGGKLAGVADVKNETSKEGTRLVFKLRRDAVPHVVLNHLYKHTQLQDTFGVIMLALVNNVPRVLNLAEVLTNFIKHQIEVVTRRTKFELRKAEERAHILQGLLIAIEHIDEVIALIRAAASAEVAKTELMSRFGLSEVQALAILDMQLRRLAALERKKITDEYDELVERIRELLAILDDPDKLRAVVKSELSRIKAKHADARRTELRPDEGEFSIEDLIAEEQVVVTVSRTGYVKRVPLDAYRAQGRGGKGVRGANLKPDDIVQHLFVTNTHHWVLFFTNQGRVYRAKVHELPEGSRTARGTYVANVPGCGFQPRERIAAAMDIKDYSSGRYLVMATKRGMTKKTKLGEYDSPRTGLIAMNLREGDELIGVALTGGNDDIMLVSRRALAVRFSEKEVRAMGRQTAGVIGMRLRPGGDVIAMDVARPGAQLLVVTENGFGKRTLVSDYPRKGRGGIGVLTARLTEVKGHLAGAMVVTEDDEFFVISDRGQVIRQRVRDAKLASRATQGTRVQRLPANAQVADIAPVVGEGQTE